MKYSLKYLMKYSTKYFQDGVSCLPFLLASISSQPSFSSSLAGFPRWWQWWILDVLHDMILMNMTKMAMMMMAKMIIMMKMMMTKMTKMTKMSKMIKVIKTQIVMSIFFLKGLKWRSSTGRSTRPSPRLLGFSRSHVFLKIAWLF